MAWSLSGYNAVISAEQQLNIARQHLEIAKRDSLPTIRTLEADLTLAEDNLRQARDAIANLSPGFVRGR